MHGAAPKSIGREVENLKVSGRRFKTQLVGLVEAETFFVWPLRPLLFISLFLVTRARSFRQELKKKKKKKKNRPLELSSEVRSQPNMIVHANNNIVFEQLHHFPKPMKKPGTDRSSLSRSRGVRARPRTTVRLCNNSARRNGSVDNC